MGNTREIPQQETIGLKTEISQLRDSIEWSELPDGIKSLLLSFFRKTENDYTFDIPSNRSELSKKLLSFYIRGIDSWMLPMYENEKKKVRSVLEGILGEVLDFKKRMQSETGFTNASEEIVTFINKLEAFGWMFAELMNFNLERIVFNAFVPWVRESEVRLLDSNDRDISDDIVPIVKSELVNKNSDMQEGLDSGLKEVIKRSLRALIENYKLRVEESKLGSMVNYVYSIFGQAIKDTQNQSNRLVQTGLRGVFLDRWSQVASSLAIGRAGGLAGGAEGFGGASMFAALVNRFLPFSRKENSKVNIRRLDKNTYFVKELLQRCIAQGFNEFLFNGQYNTQLKSRVVGYAQNEFSEIIRQLGKGMQIEFDVRDGKLDIKVGDVKDVQEKKRKIETAWERVNKVLGSLDLLLDSIRDFEMQIDNTQRDVFGRDYRKIANVVGAGFMAGATAASPIVLGSVAAAIEGIDAYFIQKERYLQRERQILRRELEDLLQHIEKSLSEYDSSKINYLDFSRECKTQIDKIKNILNKRLNGKLLIAPDDPLRERAKLVLFRLYTLIWDNKVLEYLEKGSDSEEMSRKRMTIKSIIYSLAVLALINIASPNSGIREEVNKLKVKIEKEIEKIRRETKIHEYKVTADKGEGITHILVKSLKISREDAFFWAYKHGYVAVYDSMGNKFDIEELRKLLKEKGLEPQDLYNDETIKKLKLKLSEEVIKKGQVIGIFRNPDGRIVVIIDPGPTNFDKDK